MGNSQYVSLQDAALLADKSAQTIRRLLKTNKLRYRKYKTPQGFTYLVEKTSLMDHFGENQEQEDDDLNEIEDAELVEEFDPYEAAMPIKETVTGPLRNYIPSASREAPPSQQPAFRINHYREQASIREEVIPPPPSPSHTNGTSESEGAFQSVMTQLIQQHQDDKKRLFELLEMFQKRILTLEDQIKLLESPKKKHWWQLGR